MSKFRVEKTEIDGLLLIYNFSFVDQRGFFTETYNEDKFRELGLDLPVKQINESFSYKNVLRGMHFQTKNPQGKLLRVLHGEIYDVAIDLRKDSPTYGKYHGEKLSEHENKMFYVPPGFAHGFLTLSDEALITYYCTSVYKPGFDGGILYDDPEINIRWPINSYKDLIVSEKDKNNLLFDDFDKQNPFMMENTK